MAGKEKGASKTNVSARMGRKQQVVQPPKVIDLTGMRSACTGTVREFPKGFFRRQPATDEEQKVVTAFEAYSKGLKAAGAKTAGLEQGYGETYAQMRRLGLVD